jgi:hypothetical protein
MILNKLLIIGELYRITGYDDYQWSWTSIATMVVTVFMMILAIWQVCIYAHKWYKKPADSPNRLWATLIRYHRLTRNEVQLLSKLARSLPKATPVSCLFIDPSLWDDETIQPTSDSKSQLKQKLFGIH